MFHRRGKRKMSADVASSLRDRELESKITELRELLEEEKRARKRDQYEKVRELKAAREREQDFAREKIEELKMKQLREKSQEMEMLQERMNKDFKLRMKETQRKNDEEKQKLQKELDKEHRNFKEQRKIIEKDVEKQFKQAYQTEQKKLTQETFLMSSQISEMEDKLKDSHAADRTKAEVIRQMKAELESFSHSSKLSSRQQLVELGVSQRDIKEREKEISSNLERIRRLEADKDKLQEEVRRLRRAESWARSTSTVTPPSLTPSTSNGDLTSPRQYTVKERDMVMKNTELSFRVRHLEEQNTELEKYKKELKELLAKAQAEQKPLKEQLSKQGMRVNSLNASLHDKEKFVKKVTDEIEELKKANRELTQEQAQQKRRLNQQMNQTHTLRMEHQRAVGKCTDLHKRCMKLQTRVKELEHQRRSNSHQSVATGSVVGVADSESRMHACSPSVSMTSMETSGEEGDVEQAWSKYREMKKEYVTMRDHYKKLKSSHDKLEQKVRLYEQEKLVIESEVSKLRASPINERDSPYDMMRSSTMLSDTTQQLEIVQSRVRKLEAFIVEQDKTSREQISEYKRELELVTEERDSFQEQLQSSGWQREEGEREEGEGEENAGERSSDLLQQISLVEEMNLKATAGIKETKQKAKVLEDYHDGMDKTLNEMKEGEGEEDDEDGCLMSEGELVTEMHSNEQGVSDEVEKLTGILADEQPPLNDTSMSFNTANGAVPVDASTPSVHTPLVTEIGRLKDELLLKQEAVEHAQEKVAGIQSLMNELGGRLEQEKKENEERVIVWEQEMTALQSQLSQKESKLTRLRRAIPQGVNEHMHQKLGHQVLHNLQQCKSSASDLADATSLLSQLDELEASLHSLLHTVFPDMFQQQTSIPLPSNAAPTEQPSVPSQSSSIQSSHHSTHQSDDENIVTPLSSLSSSPTHSLTQQQMPQLPAFTHTFPPLTPQEEHTPSLTTQEEHTPSLKTPEEHTHPLTSQDEHTSPITSHKEHTSPLTSQEEHTPPHMEHTSPLTSQEEHTPPHKEHTSSLKPQGEHSPLSPPLSPTHSPLHTPTTTDDTPAPPVHEVMVMRPMTCEEISIPLSALFETPPTDHTHSELHTSPADLQASPESPSHSIHEVPSSPLPQDEEINELVDTSQNSPSHFKIPSEMIPEIKEEEQQQEVQEVIIKLDRSSSNSPSNEPTQSPYRLTGGREYTHEDLDEVDLTDSIELQKEGITSGLETGTTEKNKGSIDGERWTKEDTMSPSLHYPTPPDTHRVGNRVLEQTTSTISPMYMFGKKRLRSQSMEQDEIKEEEEDVEQREERNKEQRWRKSERDMRQKERQDKQEEEKERLFVAILSYDPEAMCTTGRPDEELLFQDGATIAVRGSVNDDGFYCGSFQGKTGLVPSGFVQEMEIENSQQRRRLLNQTLTRPHIPSSPHTPHSSSRPASASLLAPSNSLFSPSGSLLTNSQLLQRTTAPPYPPTSVLVERTQQENVVIVLWMPPNQGTKVTGYHVFVDKKLRATVNGPQTRVLLSEVPEDSSVVVGVASHDQDGRQSSITTTTYGVHHSQQQQQQQQQQPTHTTSNTHINQYRLCIVLYDYDPEKMSPSDTPQLELKVAEGNLLRCYNRPASDNDEYTLAELGESNKRGLVPTEFITEVYGPSSTDPQKYEWKSPPRNSLPATSKLMLAVYDYNSRLDSPNRGMELELSFKNGDTITVYGSMDDNGFYTGQVGEAFGLVPSNFIQKEEKKETMSTKQAVGETKEIEKWDIPPGMWQQLNGQQNLVTKSRSQSDTRFGKDSSAQASEEQHSGSGSPRGSVEVPKRRWSHALPRPNFKNPFSRKKSEVSL